MDNAKHKSHSNDYISPYSVTESVNRLQELARTTKRPWYEKGPTQVEITITPLEGNTYKFSLRRGMGEFARIHGILQPTAAGATHVLYSISALPALLRALFLLTVGSCMTLLSVTERIESLLALPVSIVVFTVFLILLITVYRIDAVHLLKTTLPPDPKSPVR